LFLASLLDDTIYGYQNPSSSEKSGSRLSLVNESILFDHGSDSKQCLPVAGCVFLLPVTFPCRSNLIWSQFVSKGMAEPPLSKFTPKTAVHVSSPDQIAFAGRGTTCYRCSTIRRRLLLLKQGNTSAHEIFFSVSETLSPEKPMKLSNRTPSLRDTPVNQIQIAVLDSWATQNRVPEGYQDAAQEHNCILIRRRVLQWLKFFKRQKPILVFVRRRAGFLFGDQIRLNDNVW